MTESINLVSTQFLLGLAGGLVLGLFVGYVIAKRSKHADSNVTLVQLLSIVTLFGYIITSYLFAKDVSWIISVGILATGYGARGGELLEKLLERRK